MKRAPDGPADSLDERLQFERLATDLSASFVNLSGEAVDAAIVDAQRRIADALDLDRSTLFQRDEHTGDFLATHNWSRLEEPAVLPGVSGKEQFPWSFAKILAGQTAAFSSPEEIPDSIEREQVRRYLTKSRIALPLSADNQLVGLISFATIRVARRWPPDIVSRLRLLAAVFAGALAKKRVDAALRRALDELKETHDALRRAYDDLRLTRSALAEHERLRALAQLAGGIAHDINNALSPVTLYAQTILSSEPNLSQESRDFLQVIRRSAQDAAQTVARLREFSRERAPQWEAAPVDLNTMVDQVKSLTQARWKDAAAEQGIAIDVSNELAIDLPPVLGVESEIREALTNMVINAIEAMPHGGTITLKTAAVPRSRNEPNRIALEVADTGVGMDEETRRRCLEPFFTTKGEHGSGLGLAMVYGIVRRHGADLSIDSTPGAGTRVRITFPYEAADMTRAPLVQGPLAAAVRLRILVIDDDPVILNTLQHVLAREGHDVRAVDGGTAGINAFVDALHDSAPFDVVVSDMAMPQVDGRHVTAAVKRASPATPVVLLAGWRAPSASGHDEAGDADCVLHKPLRLGALRDALAQVTASSGPRR